MLWLLLPCPQHPGLRTGLLLCISMILPAREHSTCAPLNEIESCKAWHAALMVFGQVAATYRVIAWSR